MEDALEIVMDFFQVRLVDLVLAKFFEFLFLVVVTPSVEYFSYAASFVVVPGRSV